MVNDYALRALVTGVVIDIAYLGMPLIPFGIAMMVDYMLRVTVGLRIISEKLS